MPTDVPTRTSCAFLRWRRRAATASALLAGLIVSAAEATAAEDAVVLDATASSAPLTLQRTLPAVPLRGYGVVAGRHWTAASGGAVLEIICASADKARLTLAKYVSDLEVLPGVTAGTLAQPELTVARWNVTTLAVHMIRDQGVVLALRSGATVFVLTAVDTADLQRLLGDFAGSAAAVAGAVSTAETTVPMWLDRFDRHGFRFYYGPFTRPAPQGTLPAGAKPETYDFTQDFAFAKDSGAGLLMWATQSMQGASEGVTNANWWGWVESWAKPLGLPIGVNLSAYNFDIPNWVANRYRGDLAQPMPQYLGDSMSIGGGRGTGGKVGELTWGATVARDAMFGSLQQVVRRFAAEPNIISWLEPHGEFYQGGDAFMGYGPAVDATFRDWLKEHYRTIAAVNAAWAEQLPSFNAVKAPELAEFAGWNATALDLAGRWRVGYPQGAAPEAWFAPAFDDGAWTTLTAPGDDHAFFTPRTTAVFRRTVDVPAGHAGAGKRSWIYLWDLNSDWDKPVSIWLNGSKLGESPCRHPHAHWMVAEATAALHDGANQLALGLPQGYLGYRVYLSHTAPRQYPALGAGLNAKWVDYVAWREAERMASARRGVEMIRAVDPDRQIDFMAPAGSADGLKGLAESFGGNFKDTGFMAGLWADLWPQLMRGSRLPFTLEPGGPPRSVPEMRHMLGLYHSEAIQAMDYFMHIGDVEWDPAIRAAFAGTRPLWQAFGKYHCHPADLAILWDMGIDTLVGFPWGGDLNINSGSGWSCRQIPESLLGTHPRDGLTESDF
ncbi:MAG: beta-galactosidase, partial [Planctomycetes bacterium]|nr:beta-galactosidase [Planctomycetota bacterium]